MRVAIVSPWYIANGGAEQVDGVLASMYPNADLYTLFFTDKAVPKVLAGRNIKASPLNRVPAIEKVYRPIIGFLPYFVETIDLRGYDLVISSDWACIKGVLTDVTALHICYCHTPMRHIWDLYRTYLMDAPVWQRPAFMWSAHRLREYDFLAAQRVDHYIANSRYIARRIGKYYRRESTVIYPCVDTTIGYLSNERDTYYLAVGRLNRTKRLDLLIEACNRLGRKLVVSGGGPEEASLRSLAGRTIELVGRVPDEQLYALYANCRALLFAADEDFGIVPVEAQAFGRPVIAYGDGGSLETVRINDIEGRSDTGVFFGEQTVESVIDGILRFEAREDFFVPVEIQQHASQFDKSVFIARMRQFIDTAMMGRADR